MALTDEDKQWIEERLEQVVEQVVAKFRDMQTEVLRYIGNFAEPFNVRMRHIEANAGNLETAERLRLAAVEERLLRIEQKILGGKL
jgi:hypothetical protein